MALEDRSRPSPHAPARSSPGSPLVSIVMPVHNGAEFVRESIESALRQEYAPLELIVVDDGSTDATPEILASFGSRIVRISQPNGGAAAARNAGLEAARGELVAFLDADDQWLPSKLARQVGYLLDHPDLDLVSSRWRVDVIEERDRIGNSVTTSTPAASEAFSSEWIYNELLMDCVVHTTTVVMRRSLVDKIGMFDVTLRRGQDYDYWLRASRVTKIHRLPDVLSVYVLHARNSTWRPQRVNYAATIVERALGRWGRTGPDGRVTPLREIRGRLAELWFSFGYQHATSGSVPIALASAFRCLKAWPMSAKPWRLLAVCALAPLRRRTS
jgi:glycosyltransferase involved in cell wall biosynthesis